MTSSLFNQLTYEFKVEPSWKALKKESNQQKSWVSRTSLISRTSSLDQDGIETNTLGD